ncbi:unnamed protein product [Rotaria socialis]|nr:unnamed protein product [Rotaria socialis]CAF4651844.1 unnamed protein product [Rotaria socialis]
MVQLKKFASNIHSSIDLKDQIDLPSNENIQNTFRNFKHNRIVSCTDYFSMARVGQCHIYSYPYQLKMYEQITNSFPGGLFECVRAVSLFDERPFEHAFFLRIAQSFPLMEKLKLVNLKPQNNKQCRKPEHDDRDCSIVKYPHLNDLDLFEVHDDYIEQFLMDTKTCLPYRVVLVTNHQLLENVTHNFKSDTTRINCSKIYYLYSDTICSLPEHVKDYFFLY